MIRSDCEQGSEIWHNLRAGKLTGSEFGKVMGTTDHKRVRIIGAEPEEGFGRAKAQEAAFIELIQAGDTGKIKSEVEASGGLPGLLAKGLIEETTDSTGCTLRRSAAAKHIDLLVARTRFTPAELGEFIGTDATDRGNYLEGPSGVEFENETGITIERVGFVMHEDLNLVGVSPDGMTSDGGVFETKSLLPQNHLTVVRNRRVPSCYKAQVHGQMAVAGVNHCWFQAYCPELPTVRIKVERDAYTENLFKCLVEFEQMYINQLESYGL